MDKSPFHSSTQHFEDAFRGIRRLIDECGVRKCATNIPFRQFSGHSASVAVVDVCGSFYPISHKSPLCENLATAIDTVTLGVMSMLFRLRKFVLYALTLVTVCQTRSLCGREPTAASQRKTFVKQIQRQQERCAAIITPFAKLMRK